VEGRRHNSTYFKIWQYLEMIGQMSIFAALPPVAMELEAGRTAEPVLTLIGDKNICVPVLTAMTVLRYIISLPRRSELKIKEAGKQGKW